MKVSAVMITNVVYLFIYLFTIKQVMCIKKAVRDHFDIMMTIHIVCSTGVGGIKEHQDRNGKI